MKYAVSMGNSQLGRHAIDFLSEKGVPANDIVAVARNTAKAADLAGRSHGTASDQGTRAMRRHSSAAAS